MSSTSQPQLLQSLIRFSCVTDLLSHIRSKSHFVWYSGTIMVLSDLSSEHLSCLSAVYPPPLISCDKWHQLIIQTRSTGQIRSDISHDDISDSDQGDHCPVRVLQSLTRVTGDLIMIIIISAIITSNDTHTHPPHTITGFIWQHSPQDKVSQSPLSAPGTTLVTSNNGLIMPGSWVATGNINNTHHEPGEMTETF